VKTAEQAVSYEKNLRRCAELIGARFENMAHLITSVQEFIYFNSVNGCDDEREEFKFSTELNVRKLLLAAISPENPKALLTCGPRARLMRDILLQYDVYSKLILLFSGDFNKIKGHQVIEVWNEQERIWEARDPHFNVVYADAGSLRAVTFDNLVFGDPEKVTPVNCNAKGWKETHTEHLKEHYFQAILYYSETSKNNAVILVNGDRMNVDKLFVENGMTFVQWARKHYGRPRIITLQ
jgi:hypothetical protein